MYRLLCKFPGRASQRRNEILGPMVAEGEISANETTRAERARILTQRSTDLAATSVVIHVLA
jgi:membrane peptidoglycan carboxypeptidase